MHKGRTSHVLGDFVVLDFEASNLCRDGWPIEIGLSWVTARGQVKTWASLIRPHDRWSTDHWSEESASVHGVPFEDLQDAPAVEGIARETLERCRNRVVVSDAPEFEQRWLDKLLDTIDMVGEITVRDYDVTSFRLFDGFLIDRVYEYLARHRAPHRAGPDSRRLAAAWLTVAQRR